MGALAAVALLATLHIWALRDFLYWQYRWFDTPMHLLGGAAIGAFTVGLLHSWRPFLYLSAIVFVSFSWELMEYIFGLTGVNSIDYTWDTAHDLLNDAIGATFVYVLARYTLWRSA